MKLSLAALAMTVVTALAQQAGTQQPGTEPPVQASSCCSECAAKCAVAWLNGPAAYALCVGVCCGAGCG